jgi:hypothetical protein
MQQNNHLKPPQMSIDLRKWTTFKSKVKGNVAIQQLSTRAFSSIYQHITLDIYA